MRTVRELMSSPAVTVSAGATLPVASATMDEAGVSSLPVIDDHGSAVGVISRSDLLRAGVRARPGSGDTLIPMPNVFVGAAMSRELVTVAPSTTTVEAARLMVDRRIHGVLVESGRALVGVLSATDLMRCLAESGLAIPLRSIMRSPVAAVPIDTPLGLALAELGSHGVGALVVTEHDEAVGLFSRADALAAGDQHDDAPVGDAMSLRYIVEVASAPVHRAAARAVALDVRHVLVRDAQREEDRHCVPGIVGMVSRLDLAGALLLAKGG